MNIYTASYEQPNTLWAWDYEQLKIEVVIPPIPFTDIIKLPTHKEADEKAFCEYII